MPDPVVNPVQTNQAPSTPAPSAPATPAPSTPSTPAASTPADSYVPGQSFEKDMLRGIEQLQQQANQPSAQQTPAAQQTVPGAAVAPGDPTAPGAQQPVGQQPVAPQPAPQDLSWAPALASQLGVDLKHFSENGQFNAPGFLTALKSVVSESAQQARQLQELKAQMPYYNAWQTGAQTPPAQQQQPAQPQTQPKIWEAPDYDERWESMITRKEDGTWEVPQGAPPDLLHKRQQFFEHRMKVLNDFARDPMSIIGKFMPKIEETAKKVFDTTYQDIQNKQTAESIIKSNESWMTQVNPLTGQRTWTETGVDYANEIKRLNEIAPGMSPAVADELAKKVAFANMQLKIAQRQQQQPAQQQPIAPQQPTQFPGYQQPQQFVQQPQQFAQQQPPAQPQFNWQQPAPMPGFTPPGPAQNAFTQPVSPQTAMNNPNGIQGVPINIAMKQHMEQLAQQLGIPV